MVLSQALLSLLVLALASTILARTNAASCQNWLERQESAERIARQERIEAFEVQKPMHTTALLAGAAAKPTPPPIARGLRVRGEEADDEEMEDQLFTVQRREGWAREKDR